MIIQSTREATREELIQRIEELEKENKYLRDENAIYKNETISKSVIRDKIIERQFELQQEYEDFENDIKLNTLIEILGDEQWIKK